MAYSSELFKETDPKGFTSFVGTDRGGLANFLIPAGTGGVDVLNDYRWTLTDRNGRNETPRAVLTEWRLLQSSLLNSARYYAAGLSQLAATPSNPYLSERHMNGYAGLFDFKNPTGFWYSVPYFGEISNEVSSTWTALDILEKIKNGINMISSNVGKGVDIAEALVGLGYEANYPRVGIMDRPKLWESSNFRTINIKFPLYNTVDEKDITKNWDLCYLLTYQNMFNKMNFIIAIPPVFYTVYIPGQFFSIAMYVSDLKVYNRGNMRIMNVGGKKRNIPDVYEIDITLTDMVMPSQNMLLPILQEDPITVQRLNQGLIESGIDAVDEVTGNFFSLGSKLPGPVGTLFQGAQGIKDSFLDTIREGARTPAGG